MSDEICEACGQKIEIKDRGLHNWKNLFRMPSLNDMIMLFIIVMVLVGAWAYNHDTKICRQTLNNLPAICMQYSASITNQSSGPNWWSAPLNLSDVNLVNLTTSDINDTVSDTNLSESVIQNETGTAGL